MVFTKRCCCCVNLRVGGMMMGLITFTLSVCSLIPMVLFLIKRVFVAQAITHLVNEYTYTAGDADAGRRRDRDQAGKGVALWGTLSGAFQDDDENGGEDSRLPPEDDESVVRLAGVMLIFFIVTIILLVIYAVCSFLLIYGAAKGHRWFMLPWLACTLVFLLAYLVGVILSLWLMSIQVLSVLFFFVAVVEICIAFYLWLCVLSLFQVLGSDDWRNRQEWEMKPRFSTKYDGVATHE